MSFDSVDVVDDGGTVVLVVDEVVLVEAATSAAGNALTNRYVNPINAMMTTGRIHRPGFGSVVLTNESIEARGRLRHHRYPAAMELTGRNAIVTGGGVRVGRAISLALASAGARVYIHYNSSSDAASAVRDEILGAGGFAAIGSVDLADPAAAPRLVADAEAALGAVSILVNSASGFPKDSLGTVTVKDLRDAQLVSLESPVMLTQAMASALPDDLDGAVVNVTDARTMYPYKEHLSYMLAKGALDTFTRAAALELAPRIRVNAVALGVILPPTNESDAYAAKLAETLPLARVGGTEVVADAVVFLCRNDFITGEIIRLDGGAHLQ